MPFILPVFALIFSASGVAQINVQGDAGMPGDQKALKTYSEGLEWLKQHKESAALVE